eukprot:jgi/Bigna1/67315/fgenesh1_pg.3_\
MPVKDHDPLPKSADNISQEAQSIKGKDLKQNSYLDGESWVNMVASISLYMTSSAGMSIFNKMAIKAIQLPMLLVLIQCAVVCVILIPFWSQIKLGSFTDKLKWLPAALLFVGMLGTSMVAFKYCSLGSIVVVRMCSPLLGLVFESFFKKAKYLTTIHTFISLGITIMGVILYATFQKGIHAELLGIIFLVINMLLATLDRLIQRYLLAESPIDMSVNQHVLVCYRAATHHKTNGLLPLTLCHHIQQLHSNDSGLTLYNNFACAACMPFFMYINGEFPKVGSGISAIDTIGWAFIAASCLCGVMISYTSFRVQRLISATSFLVCINMNKFVVIAYGILILHEAYKPLSAIGCAITLLGGAYYSWDRINLEKLDNVQDTDAITQKAEQYGDSGNYDAESNDEERQSLLASNEEAS